MKNLSIIISATLLLLTQVSHAQISLGGKIGIGSSNMNFTGINTSISPDTKSTLSYDLGLYTEVQIGNQLYIQPELAYVKRGFVIDQHINAEIANLPIRVGAGIQTQVNYIQAPILIKYKIGSPKIKGFIGAGPNITYATKGRINTKANFILDLNISEHTLNFSSDTYNRWGVSGDIIAGIELPTKTGAIVIEGRYSHAISEAIHIPILDIGVQSRNLGISMGYQFKF